MHGGDVLARGGRKAQFPPAGSAITQEKWDAMFTGFDPEKYRRDADAEKNGVSRSEFGKVKSGTVRTGV